MIRATCLAIVNQVARIIAQCHTIPATCLASGETLLQDKLYESLPCITAPLPLGKPRTMLAHAPY